MPVSSHSASSARTMTRALTDGPLAVMITPTLPVYPADNAGSAYVFRVAQYLASQKGFVALVEDGHGARHAAGNGQAADHRFFGGLKASGLVRRLECFQQTLFPGSMPRRLQNSLLQDAELRGLIQRAAVVDLQWFQMGSLANRIRKINPQAKIVCTAHDVLSQRYSRAQNEAKGRLRKIRWFVAAQLARRLERKLSRVVDVLVFLSEKDAALVPKGSAEVVVVHPPLATQKLSQIQRQVQPLNILFVAHLARWENEQGLFWFMQEVLPKIRRQYPAVRVQVAGTGVRPHVQVAADTAGIKLLGFVPDLTPLYAAASVVVVPLHLGAGVKFKVVEALLAGVPVVTTPVGAEGIGDLSWYAAVNENAAEFAAGVKAVLANQSAAENRSGDIRELVTKTYGFEKFEASMNRAYAVPTGTKSQVVLSRGAEKPDASVVIPVRNGAETIEKQLQALANQAMDLALEVIVADNGSTDETRAIATRWTGKFHALKIIDAGGVRGAAYARNEGVRHAGSEKILFCDADDVVRPGWVRTLTSALDGHSYVGSAVQKVTSGAPGVSAGSPAAKQEAPMSVHGFLGYALSGSCAVRRDAFMSVGGFDTSYKDGHEEADFGWRMQLAGHELLWLSDTVIDYMQRTDAKSMYRQNFRYAKSAILLWTRFNQDHQLSPVSFKGSIRNFAAQLSRIGLLLNSEKQMSYAQSLGWTAGTVAGHLEYRIIRRVLERQLMEVNE